MTNRDSTLIASCLLIYFEIFGLDLKSVVTCDKIRQTTTLTLNTIAICIYSSHIRIVLHIKSR